ncbi:hypothetical protein AM571_PC01110 (plasmid) [Rhizobium etli 8C-3]|uniref:ATP-dependent RecD2 DNA helicase-like helix-hairpin-helix domain-containing protein n=1 Tax=Rhizobium etli 8C-3 TaxID=538025 RepID=A0A1L5PFD8_RHIET|nr:helix-hairpin-helix domain-containing protein [Rhizobium etli]APO78845.1 hypothetical protein AM571_PC01110 [Rhizobium etli 8C-3]
MTKGRATIRNLATGKRFVGIGWATAEKVWERFGETMYDIIRDRDLKALADMVGADRAIAIADGGDPSTMTLLEPWKDVDARALRLGIALDDPRRLMAAVEEALAIRFRAGHMASPSPGPFSSGRSRSYQGDDRFSSSESYEKYGSSLLI